MKKQLWILVVFAFLISACQKEDDFFNDIDDGQAWVDDGQGGQDGQNANGEEGSLTLYRVTEDDISKIKDFPVGNDLKPYQQDYAKHFQMWEFFTRMLPLEERDKITEFEVFHGGGQLLGYVFPIDGGDLSKWRFALAIDAAEKLDEVDFNDLFTFVTLHEYGHVLTLNDEQVQVTDGSSCGAYFTGEGCSNTNSYINRLVELGWSDILDEINEDDPYQLYDRYPDRFVTDYAATNPGEDVAEVFSFFVAKDVPAGNSIADQKIKMMYDFPELVALRDAIRQRSLALGIRPDGWVTNTNISQFRICNRKGCKHTRRNEAVRK